MCKTLPAKSYQKQTKTTKKLMNDIKFFLKKKKKKTDNIAVNVTKISRKMKSKSLLCLERNIIKWGKIPYYNCRKVVVEKILLFIRESVRNTFLLRLCLKSSLSTNKQKKKTRNNKKFSILWLYKFLKLMF